MNKVKVGNVHFYENADQDYVLLYTAVGTRSEIDYAKAYAKDWRRGK